MKTLLTILILMFTTCVYSQIAPPRKKINLMLPPVSASQSNAPVGPIMMLGGASFIAAGLLAPPNMVGGSTTQKQPIVKQLHKVLPIASGCVILVVGVSISIGSL